MSGWERMQMSGACTSQSLSKVRFSFAGAPCGLFLAVQLGHAILKSEIFCERLRRRLGVKASGILQPELSLGPCLDHNRFDSSLAGSNAA